MQTLKLILCITLILTSTNMAHGGKKQIYENYEDVPSEDIDKFILHVRSAVAKDDRLTVARLANCNKKKPCEWIKLDLNDKSQNQVMHTTSTKEFLKYYDLIITEVFKEIIQKESVLKSIWMHKMDGYTIM